MLILISKIRTFIFGLLFVFGSVSLLSPVLWAETKKVEKHESLILEKVVCDSESKASFVTVHFNKKPDWTTITLQDHGSFIQIGLPETVILNPGTFYEGAGPYFKKVAVYQASENEGALRIFLGADATKIKNATTVEILNNVVAIKLEHDKLKDLQASAEKPVSLTLPGADEVISKTKVSKDIPAPAGLLKAEKEGKEGEQTALNLMGGNVPDLKNKLTGVSIFSAILLFCLLLFYLARPLFKKRRQLLEKEVPLSIKMLTTLPLTAKQKLALVQVGQEKILLSVSPESVNYIVSVNQKSDSYNMQNRLLTPNVIGSLPIRSGQMLAVQEQGTIDMNMAPIQNNSITETPEQNNRLFKSRLTLGSHQNMASSKIQTKTNDSEQPQKIEKNQKPVESTVEQKVKNDLPPPKINVAVGDNGIINRKIYTDGQKKPIKTIVSKEPGTNKVIEDVTSLIREKLKTLPII